MAKAIDKLMHGVEILVTAILAAEVVVVVMQIFCRYVLSTPLNWSDQMSRFGLVWIIMLGIPVMFNRRATVAFDLIYAKTRGKCRKAFQILFALLGVVFALVFMLCSIQYVQKSGGLVVPGFPWMKFYSLYVSEVIGAALLLVVMVKETVLAVLAKPESKDQGEG